MHEDAQKQLSTPIPVLLLKTKSSPADSYEELLLAGKAGRTFRPIFVPVLEHQADPDGIAQLIEIWRARRVGSEPVHEYGGMIFTSQRAVEAFAKLLHDHEDPALTLGNVPIYSVGPATTKALKSIPQIKASQIFGEHAGNGGVLAHFILDHYGQRYHDCSVKPPLLFLVGQERRDIIPKTIMADSLPSDRRIQVDELVVYRTEEMKSFSADFEKKLADLSESKLAWVVVFSPTGCEAMLRGLGFLDRDSGHMKDVSGFSRYRVMTIGPTTRDYLKQTFSFDPDVCAEKPSPQGVLEGMLKYKCDTT